MDAVVEIASMSSSDIRCYGYHLYLTTSGYVIGSIGNSCNELMYLKNVDTAVEISSPALTEAGIRFTWGP